MQSPVAGVDDGACIADVGAFGNALFPRTQTDLSMRVRVPHVRIIHVVHIVSPVRETAGCCKHDN